MRCSRNILSAGMRVAALCTVIVAIAVPAISEDETIRIGMIGLDTSHATDFTAILNEGQVAGARVVAGVKQFSPDIEYSATNVDKYVELLTTKYGLELYDSVEDMLPHVDGVMVESVDGRPHLAQARPAIEAGKLVFVDKPMAASLADVIEMFQLARKHHTQVWSASNLRYHPGVVAARDADIGELVSVFSHGPAPVEEHHPDLMWYGIHPVEAMFTVMGTGCETVQRTHTAGTDLITGTWQDGRIGFVMGMRAAQAAYSVKVFGTAGIVEHSAGGAYPELLTEVVKFFRTGKPPVDEATTIEIFAFMEAADESKRLGGTPVSIEETIAKHSNP